MTKAEFARQVAEILAGSEGTNFLWDSYPDVKLIDDLITVSLDIGKTRKTFQLKVRGEDNERTT